MARINIQAQQIDAVLQDWNHVDARFKGGALFIGNGASRAVWDNFGYASLYVQATGGINHPLTAEDQAFFTHLQSENFEQVLAILSTSESVGQILGHSPQVIQSIHDRYTSIQTALVEAVHAVHIRRENIPDINLQNIQDELRNYDTVYSTNYDLLVYWAMMHNNDTGAGFRDYFWSSPEKCFDIADTNIWQHNTKVLYLHGGLHLYYYPITRRACKAVKAPNSNLLDQFGRLPAGAVPLFVSEGDAESKKNTISGSSYLSFAFSQFQHESQAMVIFGNSLGDSDKHFVDAIVAWGNRPIAISMRQNGDARQIRAEKAAYHNRLQKDDIAFFDAETHPLGHPNLNVPVP